MSKLEAVRRTLERVGQKISQFRLQAVGGVVDPTLQVFEAQQAALNAIYEVLEDLAPHAEE